MHKKLQQPQDCNGMLGYTQHPEREENINHYKKKKTLGEVVKGNAHSRCSVSESRRRNTKQPLWFDRPYMLMLGRPNSCCGSHEAPPPLPCSSTQPAPHPLWTCNNKALINKVSLLSSEAGQTWTPLFVPLPAQQHPCWHNKPSYDLWLLKCCRTHL